MKRLFLILTMVGLLLPFAPRMQAATEVSLNLFYDNLSPYGGWIETPDYGYVFQPAVAVNNSSWRPYTDGYWAYTDAGWTWVSYEDFGWATYHYGRWALLTDYGWVWVPGYEWGPAWVSWRTGGDYVGWAPLPPGAGEQVYEGRAITGHVDLTFDIGPLYYNFVDIRYIGEPVLRRRIVQPERNATIINRTVNVTNITYTNSIVHNYGPDFNRVNQYSTRPVQRLTLERETDVTSFQGRQGNFNRVNANRLVVAAPAVEKTNQYLAPRQVKAKVQKPRVEHGWQGVQNREQLQQEMRKENAKNVPPPKIQPQNGRRENAANQPNETNQPGQQADTNQNANQQGGGQQEAAQRRQQRAEERQKGQQQQQEQNQPPSQQQDVQERANPHQGRVNVHQAQQRQARENERARATQEKQNQHNAEPGGGEQKVQSDGQNRREQQRQQTEQNRMKRRADKQQQEEKRQAQQESPDRNAQPSHEESNRSAREQHQAQQARQRRADQAQHRQSAQQQVQPANRQPPQARRERERNAQQNHRRPEAGQPGDAGANENQKKKKKAPEETPHP